MGTGLCLSVGIVSTRGRFAPQGGHLLGQVLKLRLNFVLRRRLRRSSSLAADGSFQRRRVRSVCRRATEGEHGLGGGCRLQRLSACEQGAVQQEQACVRRRQTQGASRSATG